MFRIYQRILYQKIIKVEPISSQEAWTLFMERCFLYCAVFPEDFMIPRKVLVRYLIDEGVIKGFNSMVVEFDKGHSMFNRLENVFLLEGAKMYGDRSCVKMQDLIRNMASKYCKRTLKSLLKQVHN
jgi:disease resistance protein RPS2